MDTWRIIELLLLGLATGTLGGLLGIGGSILMIPALTIVSGPNQHLYQAASMIVGIFVAIPATWRHGRARAIRWDVFLKMLPFGLVAIVIGVLVSDMFDQESLKKVFGLFLLYVTATELMKHLDREREPAPSQARVAWRHCGFAGAIMGFSAGLFGVGGGSLAVPLLQRVCNLPLRQSIATSSAVMCLTAAIGALSKNATLQHRHGLDVYDSLIIASFLAPGAIIGGLIGAGLTHRLPLHIVRVAFILLMTISSCKMLGLF